MHKVRRCVFDVNNLQSIAFINTYGKTANIDPEKLNGRPGGLTFFRLSCEIYRVDTDPRFHQKNSTFGFASTFPNSSIISPTGLLRPSDLPGNASK